MEPIFKACIEGDLDMFNKNNNNIWIEDKKGWNLLMYCCFSNKKIKININRLAILNVLLEEASKDPNFSNFINKQDRNGLTALIMASMDDTCYGSAAVELLLKFRANKNIRDKNGWTALLAAGYSGNIRNVKLLNSTL